MSRAKKIRVGKVSFQEEFYSDISLKNMLYAKVIRCSEKGRITSLVPPDFPEGFYFFTARDIPGQHFIGNTLGRVPIFCEGESLYPGEQVGILVGNDEDKLDEIASLFKIQCDKETIETDFRKNNTSDAASDAWEIFSSILAQRTVESGPCFRQEGGFEKIFEEASYTVEHTWSFKLNERDSRECDGAICDYDGKILTVYTPTQWLSNLRQTLSDALGMKAEDIVVKKTKSYNHGSTSIWYNSIIACQVAVASYKLKRPVKLVYSRLEQETFINSMLPVEIHHKTAVDARGRILAMRVDISLDAGAHNPFAQEIMDRLVIASCGCYNPFNIKITALAYSSSKPSSSIDLRIVDSAAFFAVENQMDLICKECRISPLEIRFINFLSKDLKNKTLPFYFGLKKYFFSKTRKISGKEVILKKQEETYEHIVQNDISYDIPFYSMLFDKNGKIFLEFEHTYEAYRQEVYKRRERSQVALINSKDYPLRGIGFACAFEGSCYFGSQIYGDSSQSLEVTFTEDKNLVIHCSPVSYSIQEIWKEIASEITGLSASAIKINSIFEADEEPPLPESVYSNVSVMTSLLQKCCLTIKNKIPEGKTPITVKKSVSSARKKNWDLNRFSGQPFHSVSFSAAIVEVELDPCTFREKVKQIKIFIDGGKILNPIGAQAAVKLGIQKILSALVSEDILDCNFQNIQILFLESNAEPAQIGEQVYQVIPAAYTQAISQALDCTLDYLPISVESIYDIVKENAEAVAK